MRGSTILLSYAKGSRGLLITQAHPTYEGFYYTVIKYRGEQRTINHPSPPPPHYDGFYYTVIICQGEQRTINHPCPPPPPYEVFYSPVIICQGYSQRTLIHMPCQSPAHPPMRGSTILLSYAKESRGLLITPAHPTYEGFYYTVIICQGEQRTINHPSPPHPPL